MGAAALWRVEGGPNCGWVFVFSNVPNIRARIESAHHVSAADYARMTKMRAALMRRMDGRLTCGEIFALPTVPIIARTIESVRRDSVYHHVNTLLLRNTCVANLLDLPA